MIDPFCIDQPSVYCTHKNLAIDHQTWQSKPIFIDGFVQKMPWLMVDAPGPMETFLGLTRTALRIP